MGIVVTGFALMKKATARLFFLLVLPISIHAQSVTVDVAIEEAEKEQGSFLEYIDGVSFDSNIIKRLSGFVLSEADSIQQFIIADSTIQVSEKVRAIRSLLYFLNEIRQDLTRKQLDVYDIPVVLESYKLLLRALLYHQSYIDILVPLNSRCSRLMTSAFWQYDECTLLDEISIYKLIVTSPDNILRFLEWFPLFRFADSLLIVAAFHDPMKIASYLLQNRTALLNNTRGKENIYLRQIVSLAEDPNASELIPFITPIAGKRITAKEVVEKRMDITVYFQMLVNTLKTEIALTADSSFLFHTPLRNAIKEKSISFYVNRLNELHGYPDNVRFSAIKDLRIEDIYYIMTSCETELYTSSYLGLYRRMMECFRFQSADSIFRLVQYDNFYAFMRMAANYNTLADFLSCMSQEKAAELLKRFISGIESDRDSGLKKAMDIADSFTGLCSVTGISDIIHDELQFNLGRCQSGQLYFGIRIYSILLQVFDLVKQKDSLNKLWTYLGNHEILRHKSLQNEKGEIIELVLFYGDEDGIASFNNFLTLFQDSCKWETSKNDFWITIRSHSNQSIIIYANLPLDNEPGMDFNAQDSLSTFLQQKSEEPSILIHRGHSYHLNQTLKRLQPSVKLTILGSCGGYNSILSVANISPDAQIIFSKQSGSKIINDPMIEVINETLQNENDLIWTEVWEKLRKRFGNDEAALNLFNEYIPPGKNVSLFVLKLFNFFR